MILKLWRLRLGADDSVDGMGSGASFLNNESSGWNGW